MFELIYDRHDPKAFNKYKEYISSKNKEVHIFQDRIFLDISEQQILVYLGGAKLFLVDCNPRLTSANWLKQIVVLTHRYPSAHHQLKIAIEQDLSVEEFVSNVAKSFCDDWKKALDLI